MENTKDKIVDIETALAYHEQQIAQMSDVITDQWKMIESLKKTVVRLGDKLEQIECDRSGEDQKLSSVEKARQDIPPHY